MFTSDEKLNVVARNYKSSERVDSKLYNML